MVRNRHRGQTAATAISCASSGVRAQPRTLEVSNYNRIVPNFRRTAIHKGEACGLVISCVPFRYVARATGWNDQLTCTAMSRNPDVVHKKCGCRRRPIIGQLVRVEK